MRHRACVQIGRPALWRCWSSLPSGVGSSTKAAAGSGTLPSLPGLLPLAGPPTATVQAALPPTAAAAVPNLSASPSPVTCSLLPGIVGPFHKSLDSAPAFPVRASHGTTQGALVSLTIKDPTILNPPFSVRGTHTATGSAKREGEDILRQSTTAAMPGGFTSHQQQQQQSEHLGAAGDAPGPEPLRSSESAQSYWSVPRTKLYREDGTEWPWHCFTPSDTYRSNTSIDLGKHFKPNNFGDTFAKYLVKSLRIPTDLFFQRRYGCRAMMLETVAAVPGMVAGMLLHLKSLRLIEHSGGWIKALLEEAENERMHLMTFMEVAQPKWYERGLIFAVQAVFFTAYTAAYAVSPRIAHRIVGYLEEEAVHSYTEFLKDIDAGEIENVPAPQIAIDYWRLPKDARLREVVVAVRADEAHHRDVNHFAANVVQEGKKLKDNPAPMDYH